MLDFDRDFRVRVLAVIAQIPAGRVMTYGQVALWAGFPGQARQVGQVLFGISDHEVLEAIPWQRVVNAQGGISTVKIGIGDLQRRLLEVEGVIFKNNEKLNLKQYQWSPDSQIEPEPLFEL
jgi:methylated-DNA-protein-cysteine methyltransferase related protein